MTATYHRIAFTDSVKRAQERNGVRDQYARFEERNTRAGGLGEQEKAFIAERDTLFMASVGENGWPYVQHRGGPPGFLKVLDEHTLGFADFRGNRQYISLGNLQADDRVALILMDFAHQTRLKIYARARAVEINDEPDLIGRLGDPAYHARVERGILLDVEAVDWNCPQHIVPRFTEAEVMDMVQPLQEHIARLEAEVAEAQAAAVS